MRKIAICVFGLLLFFPIKVAYSAKIVAIVNDDVITDVDVDDFEKILCKLDKRFKCGSQNSRQLALISLAESTLKMEHFRQIKIIDDPQIKNGFQGYKNNVLNDLKLKQQDISKVFDEYLQAEYIWGIMLSSQVRNEHISDNEVMQFLKQKNMSEQDKNKARQMLLQEKMSTLSQNIITDLKKFYLVDIKGL